MCSLVTGWTKYLRLFKENPLWLLLMAVWHFPGLLVVLETTKPTVRNAVSPARGTLRHLQLGGIEKLSP